MDKGCQPGNGSQRECPHALVSPFKGDGCPALQEVSQEPTWLAEARITVKFKVAMLCLNIFGHAQKGGTKNGSLSIPYLEAWLGGCRRRSIFSGRWSPWGRRTQRSTHGTGRGHRSRQGHKSQICPTVLSCTSAPPPAAEKAKLHQTPLSELSSLLVCHHSRKV